MKHDEQGVVFITGATGTLGTQFTEYFLYKGQTVVYTSRSKEKIAEFQKYFSTKNQLLVPILVDLEEKTAVGYILSKLKSLKLLPTALVNNARNVKYLQRQENTPVTRHSWQKELLLGTIIPYELSMALAFQEDSHLNSIINISSMYGVVAQNPNLYSKPDAQLVPHYGTAKAALIHLTKELAVQFANKNIRVNAVSFGGVIGKTDETFIKKYRSFSPQGRMLEPDEVIGPVAFLQSESASAITGHNLIADGGWSLW